MPHPLDILVRPGLRKDPQFVGKDMEASVGTQVCPTPEPGLSPCLPLWSLSGQPWGPSRLTRPPSPCSSEDSEEERRRCREAAVSASDILRQSAIHGPVGVEKEAKKKKKKSKKKAKKEASADLTTATATTSKATVGKQEKESAKFNGDVSLGTKKKKKKKKAKKAGEASPCPLPRGTAAAPAD